MDSRSLARWSSRLIALIALLACWGLLRSFAGQLERISKAKREAARSTTVAPRPRSADPPPHGRRQRGARPGEKPKDGGADPAPTDPESPQHEPVDERERERTPIPPTAIR